MLGGGEPEEPKANAIMITKQASGSAKIDLLMAASPSRAWAQRCWAPVAFAADSAIGLTWWTCLLVGVEVVEHDMESGVGIGSDDVVHEVVELETPAARFVHGRHFEVDPVVWTSESGFLVGSRAVPLL